MSSFYGGGINNSVFLDSKTELPEEGKKNTLYVTSDGIFVYDEETQTYIEVGTPKLEWKEFGG